MSNTSIGILAIAIIEVAGFACCVLLSWLGHESQVGPVLMAMGVTGGLIWNILKTTSADVHAKDAAEKATETRQKVVDLDDTVERGVSVIRDENHKASTKAADAAKEVADRTADAVVKAADKVAATVAQTTTQAIQEVAKVVSNKPRSIGPQSEGGPIHDGDM